MSDVLFGVCLGLFGWFTLEAVMSAWNQGETIRVDGGTLATSIIMALLAAVGVAWFL